MSRFNAYFANHFAACRLLATGYDQHRLRHVKAYLVPGYQDEIGMTDGTDCWIAPVTSGFSIFKDVDLRKLVNSVFAGENPPVAQAAGPRRRVTLDDEPAQAAPRRRRVIEEEPHQPEQPMPRRRRVL